VATPALLAHLLLKLGRCDPLTKQIGRTIGWRSISVGFLRLSLPYGSAGYSVRRGCPASATVIWLVRRIDNNTHRRDRLITELQGMGYLASLDKAAS